MEYSVKIKFIKEVKEFEVSYNDLNFDSIIKSIIKYNYEVSKENIQVEKMQSNSNIDASVVMDLLILVHSKYLKEIELFHENIKNEIKTLKMDDELEEEIRNHLFETYGFNVQ